MLKKKFLFGCLGTLMMLVVIFWWSIQSLLAQRRLAYYQQPPSPFPLVQQWQVPLGYSNHDIPIYQDGMVMLPADTHSGVYWYGVSAKTGDIVWSRWTTMILSRIPNRKYHRCLLKDYLVIGGQNALLVLNPASGYLQWQKTPAASPVASQGTCNQDTVFASKCPRCGLSAIDLATGDYKWRGTTYRAGLTLYNQFYNPINDTIIARAVTGEPKGYYVVNPQTGVVVSYLGDRLTKSPAPAHGVTVQGHPNPVYVVEGEELFMGGTMLDAYSYDIIHEEHRYNPYVPPTVTKDTIYLGDSVEDFFDTAGFIALDRTTYEVKWAYHLSARAYSSMTILDGVGYVIFSDATLRAFDIETGAELGYWQPPPDELAYWPVCNYEFFDPFCGGVAGLATSEDTLFVSFGDGILRAFSKP